MPRNTYRNVFFGLLASSFIIVIFVVTQQQADLKRLLRRYHLAEKPIVIQTLPRTDPAIKSMEIPAKIIHQSWKVSLLPKKFARWSKSWKTCFPTWQYRLWNDTENRLLIAAHYPWFLSTYDKLPDNINRVDSIRYVYLFHYGGIYSDLDNECLQPFEHLLKNYSLVFGAMEGQFGLSIREGYVQNSFMYSRPRHPFWLEVLHAISNRAWRANAPESVAGPITLIECINAYRQRHTNDIKVYPPLLFNPNSWLKTRKPGCKDYNQMSLKEEQQCKKNYNSSYVIQYHTQTWGRGKKITKRV